jgi:hypothetical protein
MTGESEILNLLRALDAKIDDIGTRLDHIDQEHGRALELLRQDVGGIRVAQAGHGNTLHILLQDTRMLRAALNDVAKESVTPGEVEALHEDLSRLQQQVSELTARLAIVEGRDQH